MPNATAEKQLFDWAGGWDQFDTAGFTFYDVTLKVPMGPFTIGAQFSVANVDYEKSIVELLDGETSYKFPLILSVGPGITLRSGE